ncbi:MAG: type II toxin-antitoxin system prevent-host-death family antitoxin [Spirochaetes bacterium]|nr:MAG: type II toxin-antitoxin system prevent-host-death family antitoxin [Spirochaetota bacterium]
MKVKEKSVGSFEAKTCLAALLEEAAGGASVTITRRGTPVARIVPFAEKGESARRDAVQRLAEIRATVRGDGSIRELIGEGRKR